jgi:hypothetical protein
VPEPHREAVGQARGAKERGVSRINSQSDDSDERSCLAHGQVEGADSPPRPRDVRLDATLAVHDIGADAVARDQAGQRPQHVRPGQRLTGHRLGGVQGANAVLVGFREDESHDAYLIGRHAGRG